MGDNVKRVMVIKVGETFKHQIECRYCDCKFSETTPHAYISDRLYRERDLHMRLNHSHEYWDTWRKLND